jgi:hypothetical protein
MKISGFCALFLMVVVTAFAFRATGPSWFSGKSLVIMKIPYNIIIRQSLLVKNLILEVLNIVLPLIIFIFIVSLRRAGCILW